MTADPPADAVAPAKKNDTSLARLAPLLLFLFAAALRLWGITWALPTRDRAFSFHPDESVVVGYSLTLNPFALKLDPAGFYNYGSLGLLLNSLFIQIGRLTGLDPAPDGGPIPLPFYTGGDLLTSRLVTVFLGAGACLFVYAAGRRLYGAAAGGAAGLLLAVAPLAVQHGHFATVDVPATFFIAGSLFFAARYLTGDTERARDLLWAGVWAGLAAAVKYNALLVVLAAFAAWFLRRPRGPVKGLGLAALGAAAGFVVGCPGVFLNPKALIGGVLTEAGHVREGHGDVFAATPPGVIYHAAFNLRWGLGLPLLLLTLFAVSLALYRRRPADLLLLAFALPYYLGVGLAEVKFARYMLPIFPPLLLLAGAALTGWRPRSPAARALPVLGALAGAYALLFSLALDRVMTLPDTRDEAGAYLRQAPGVASVGFESGPWFYSPSLGPLFTMPFPKLARESTQNVQTPPTPVPCVDPDGAPVEWSAALLTATNPDAVALSEFKYDPALRAKLPGAIAYLDRAQSDYKNVKVFARPVEVLGIPLAKGTENRGLPFQHLPHDMLYTNPTTVVLTR
jgi:4-amino-4-deoxy-L-arabinose transferase-like glycosyltransferase